jgi:hypothetical protein
MFYIKLSESTRMFYTKLSENTRMFYTKLMWTGYCKAPNAFKRFHLQYVGKRAHHVGNMDKEQH